MFKLDFSVRRVYVASFAAIAYVFAHRSVASHDWHITRTLSAIASDAAILALLFFAYAALDRWLQPKSLAAKSHRAFHFAITLTAIALATGAQVLYQKTGEILDIGIVRFFLTNLDDLTGASQSVIDQDVLLMVVACFGFYFLSLIRMRTPLLKSLQYALFFCPLLLLGFNFVYDQEDSDDAFLQTPENPLYKGKYANLTATQHQWLASNQAFWREGILSGLSASAAHGITEFRSIEESVTPTKLYASPQKLTPPRITPNILLIILESTRADVIGAYSESSPSVSHTPYIDTLANNGWLYERAYTTIPHTSKALVGIYCGTFAKFGTDSFESTENHYPVNCLPKLLEQVGYRSGHFQTAPGTFEDRSRFLVNAGFGHAVVQEDLNPDQQTKFGYLGLDDRLLVDPMLDWMEKQRSTNRPFFASMLTVMTHHPYVSPANQEPLRNPVQGRQLYLSAMRYTDGVVRELIEGMKTRRLLENTVVIITGDHGEGFSEHGQVAHNGTAYEEGMRVPLIAYAPELLTGTSRIKGLRQHIDIMPSLLALISSEHDGIFLGKNLFIDTEGHDEIITACFYENYCLNHYLRDGTKLAYFFGKRPTELYDLDRDPLEQNNLALQIGSEQVKSRLKRAAFLKKSFSQIYAE